MAKCISCSAPLPANINQCSYCGTRNDVDLHSRHTYDVIEESSDRLCPHCDKPLQTINLDLGTDFLIERCPSCFGLFFDPGEIETLLENSVSHVFDINLQQLDNINTDRYAANNTVKYIKCPVCRTFMNRRLFGHRSGVIIDRCNKHGIWLDSGELTHLMEWKKAGGQLLDQQQALSERQKRKPPRAPLSNDNAADYVSFDLEVDVLSALASMLGKLIN